MKRQPQKRDDSLSSSIGCLPFVILILIFAGIIAFSYKGAKRDVFNIINGTADVNGFFTDVRTAYEKNISSPDFIKPLNGNITSPFGERINPLDNTKKENHTGIDIDTNLTFDVCASADGKIEKTGEDERFGNYIIIKHNSVYSTCYAHLEKLFVKTGDKVKKGDKIAQAGETGMATGKHLHFEIRKYDERKDPQKYLSDR